MSDKLVVLKLLWSNLKYLKENGKSPDQTFDFLGENEMVKYLFNEDERYIELLVLSLEMQPLEVLKKLNPTFVKMWSGFWSRGQQTQVAQPKEEKVKEEVKEVKPVKKVQTVKKVETKQIDLEEDSVADDESVVESEAEEELSDDDGEDVTVGQFISKYLMEDDESKATMESIKTRYAVYCDENEVDPDDDELESSLVQKFGKPKGKKKPKFVGVKLL